ncbi:hypothetical protein Bbelb_301410 [Branchiostoma belcheri]|nr:hypothetical protein Bbelb_301410 [Branchiostoma belcheri]
MLHGRLTTGLARTHAGHRHCRYTRTGDDGLGQSLSVTFSQAVSVSDGLLDCSLNPPNTQLLLSNHRLDTYCNADSRLAREQHNISHPYDREFRVCQVVRDSSCLDALGLVATLQPSLLLLVPVATLQPSLLLLSSTRHHQHLVPRVSHRAVLSLPLPSSHRHRTSFPDLPALPAMVADFLEKCPGDPSAASGFPVWVTTGSARPGWAWITGAWNTLPPSLSCPGVAVQGLAMEKEQPRT